jgi:hypothetical protein
VHDALYAPAVDRLVAGVPSATSLKWSILSHHTTAEDAGRVAQAAGVDAARKHFQGSIVVGKDLLEV